MLHFQMSPTIWLSFIWFKMRFWMENEGGSTEELIVNWIGALIDGTTNYFQLNSNLASCWRSNFIKHRIQRIQLYQETTAVLELHVWRLYVYTFIFCHLIVSELCGQLNSWCSFMMMVAFRKWCELKKSTECIGVCVFCSFVSVYKYMYPGDLRQPSSWSSSPFSLMAFCCYRHFGCKHSNFRFVCFRYNNTHTHTTLIHTHTHTPLHPKTRVGFKNI